MLPLSIACKKIGEPMPTNLLVPVNYNFNAPLVRPCT